MTWQNPWYDASLAHHTLHGFCNPEEELRQSGDLQRWRRERKQQNLLLRLNQRYILIDPALSARVSPLPFVGPQRNACAAQRGAAAAS